MPPDTINTWCFNATYQDLKAVGIAPDVKEIYMKAMREQGARFFYRPTAVAHVKMGPEGREYIVAWAEGQEELVILPFPFQGGYGYARSYVPEVTNDEQALSLAKNLSVYK